jgi:endogenous inhibitor of DNA gyrase (YacG/DUF329 family)
MSAQAQRPAPRVPCPRCGTLAAFGPQNKWRPFCSERCRSLDLGAWASEQYRVPTRPSEDDETPDTPPEDTRN